jgi:diaminopimelate decarboxylase
LALHDALVDCGLNLTELDVGGGLGVRYRDELVPTPADHVALVRRALGNRALKVVVEPGRSLVAEAGVLLARVITVKRSDTHTFVVADAGMSELVRPALYGAWHPIDAIAPVGEPFACEVVGPLCESGDVLGSARTLATHKDGLLAIGCAGAYGAAMSSAYNARPAAAEVMLADGNAHLVRSRGTVEELWRGEHLL